MSTKHKGKNLTKNVTCIKVKPGYGNANKEIEIRYIDTKVIGSGSFGMVYLAKLYDSSENVAIKKVFQDKRFKNRELQIMRRLEHPNIIRLMYYYYSTDNSNNEYLYLVQEFFPKNLHQMIKTYAQSGRTLDLFSIRLYMFQLFRGLSYMSSLNICHRDIKPHNLLINPEKGTLRICDFGSAKIMIPEESNVAYICSRYYRAPELIFGAQFYTTRIDVWSAGTVMAELMLGKPLFPGESAVDQIVEIIKVLGTPTKEDIYAMSPNYMEFKFPSIKAVPWEKVFKGKNQQYVAEFLSTVLKYNPMERKTAIESLAHPFFDKLRDPNLIEMPNGELMPRLFDWLEKEVNIRPDLNRKIFPKVSSDSKSELETDEIIY